MEKLYQMKQRDLKTGQDTIIYGHVTRNVIDQYWIAYIDADHVVIIQELTPSHVCAHCIDDVEIY